MSKAKNSVPSDAASGASPSRRASSQTSQIFRMMRQMQDREIFREVEPVAQAHLAIVVVADGPKIIGEEARREDRLAVFERGNIARPADVIQLVILEVSLVGRTIGDEEQRSRRKEQGRSGPLGHKELF